MTPIPVPSPEKDAGAKPQTGSDSLLSPEMLAIIHGSEGKDKKAEYEASLRRWWTEYADRKNDEEDEYVANSLLYDRNHLPRTAPAPDCCQDDLAKPRDDHDVGLDVETRNSRMDERMRAKGSPRAGGGTKGTP